MNNKPVTVQKFLALCNVLPKLADYIEELQDQKMFRQNIAKVSRMLVAEIRKTDNRFFWRDGFDKNMSIEEFNDRKNGIFDHQVQNGRLFDQWVADEFFKLEDGETIHSDGYIQGSSKTKNKDGHIYASARRNAHHLKQRNAAKHGPTKKSVLLSDEG